MYIHICMCTDYDLVFILGLLSGSWEVGGGKGEFLVKLESVSFYVFMCCYFKKTIKTNLKKKKERNRKRTTQGFTAFASTGAHCF